MIYEGGQLLAETERFPDGPRRSVADVDLDRLRQDRLRQGTFDDNRRAHDPYFRVVHFELAPPARDIGLRRPLDRFPFVPDDPARLAQDCYEAFNIQVSGLVQRMTAIGSPKPVIGVSGGLDSTHALLVVARAMDRMGRPRSDILAYTMPGFATSEHTKSNAIALAETIGASIETLDIRPLATEMLERLGHPFADGEPVHDITFENVQAGLRTDYLFRLANHHGGMVIGTSDLSELALGWATYGVGDHMSHYAVNTGIPKTLIQHVIRWVISHAPDEGGSTQLDERAREVLQSVLDTEISPELVPAGQDGRMQSTEDRIGPYALHDFALYWILRFGMRPSKIAFIAEHAWRDPDAGAWPPGFPEEDRYAYDLPTIAKWLRVFLQALLRVRAVQAVRHPERAEGVACRVAFAARRLACPVGRQRARVARRARRGAAGVRAGLIRSPRGADPELRGGLIRSVRGLSERRPRSVLVLVRERDDPAVAGQVDQRVVHRPVGDPALVLGEVEPHVLRLHPHPAAIGLAHRLDFRPVREQRIHVVRREAA